MTAGFIAFGVMILVFAIAVRARLESAAWITLTITALATLGVAATPLDWSDSIDQIHGLFAGTGYVTLASTPLLAYGRLRGAGAHGLARAGVVAGAVAAVALALSGTDVTTGLFQRLGLTVVDLWIMALAIWLMRTPTVDARTNETADVSMTESR